MKSNQKGGVSLLVKQLFYSMMLEDNSVYIYNVPNKFTLPYTAKVIDGP